MQAEFICLPLEVVRLLLGRQSLVRRLLRSACVFHMQYNDRVHLQSDNEGPN